MPPKGFQGTFFPNVIKVTTLIAKLGTRVYIDYPVAITYDIKSPDDILSVAMAINEARHDIRYKNLDWSRVYYTVGKYMYQENLKEN